MRGASDALTADLRMQLTDKLDAVGLTGQAAVSQHVAGVDRDYQRIDQSDQSDRR